MHLADIQPEKYLELFGTKIKRTFDLLSPFNPPDPTCFPSDPLGFRLRAEFRVWHEKDDLHYVMFNPSEPRERISVIDFPVAAPVITNVMPILRERLRTTKELRTKLFQVEFLSTLSGNLLISLIYHRKLGMSWHSEAEALRKILCCSLIGRSRKQKIVLGEEWVLEKLNIGDKQYHFRQPEQCFTQPNGRINEQMINWLVANCTETKTDLLELYCGIANFTIPIAGRFRRILATEVNKAAANAAKWNVNYNNLSNVELVRMSAEDVNIAFNRKRVFRRLSHLNQPLEAYRFGTVLVDPPRAGLDSETLNFVSGFNKIVYFSCNPITLAENLNALYQSHTIEALAFFDQFPYTEHMESGLILTRRSVE